RPHVIGASSLGFTTTVTLLPWIRRGGSGSRGATPRASGVASRGRVDGLRCCAQPLPTTEGPRMTRQNLFSDVWDGDDQEAKTRHRMFWRPDDARMGATLYELAPGAPESRIHMHFGAEEMFFVLSGRPLFRNQHGNEQLAPGDFVFCPEGRAGLHTF